MLMVRGLPLVTLPAAYRATRRSAGGLALLSAPAALFSTTLETTAFARKSRRNSRAVTRAPTTLTPAPTGRHPPMTAAMPGSKTAVAHRREPTLLAIGLYL